MIENACVLGATGGIGKAVVDALISRNIPTKILVRDQEKYISLYPDGELPGRVSVIQGELDSNQSLAMALEHCDTVFPCYNTKYQNWSKDMTRWTSNVADLSAALQAKIVFPGNVYNFGHASDSELRINEEHPQNAHTELGQLRIAFEQRFARAALEGASLTILRLPDVYGPAVFTRSIVSVFESALKNKPCSWYGNPHILHDFISTIDAGEAMVRAALEPRAADTVLHVPGPSPITAHEWISLVYRLAGSNIQKIYKITPKWFLKIIGLFDKQVSKFADTLYLFEESHIMDGSKYEQIVGPSPVRQYEETIKETLDWFKFWFKTGLTAN